MYNIITQQDLDILIYLSGNKKNGFSPVRNSNKLFYNKEAINASKSALEKLGFLEMGSLSNKGRYIIDALLSPEKVVITANSRLIDQAPVSYCYKTGFWTVIAPDVEARLITIASPVFTKDIKLYARQNMLYDIKIPAYEPFVMELTDMEILMFELSQLVIINRFKKKNAPLAKAESLFKAEEIFAEDALFYLAAGSDYIYPEQRRQLADLTNDPMSVKKALAGLVKKCLLDMSGTGPDTRFSHTEKSHKWLMADELQDKIVIRSAPGDKSDSYRITKSGVLKVSVNDNKVKFECVPDIDLGMFDIA